MTAAQMILCLSVYPPDTEILTQGQLGYLTIHSIEPGWTDRSFRYFLVHGDLYRNGDVIPEDATTIVLIVNTDI
jgi:hypothetical protein